MSKAQTDNRGSTGRGSDGAAVDRLHDADETSVQVAAAKAVLGGDAAAHESADVPRQTSTHETQGGLVVAQAHGKRALH